MDKQPLTRFSSVGRAFPLQGRGRGFKSLNRDSGHDRRDASGASLAELRMVEAVKVKCLRIRSEGWSPYNIWGRSSVGLEHRTFNAGVEGSSPSVPTKNLFDF